jgi:hypothetical protein
VERAFELARAGGHQSVSDITATLKREKHDSVDAHLAGPAIRKALRQACEAAAAGRASPSEPMGQATPQSA